MHLIENVLNGLPADLPAFAAVIAVILGAAFLLQRGRVRKTREHPDEPEAVVSRPEPARQMESAADVALAELARAPDLQTLQARAAEQIDAAEHALNRLLADCASIAALPIEPTFKLERQLKPEASTPARQSLAA